ncbi:MAG: hypothetical protein AB1766_00180 [Pseudomonadota bacterium]
MTAVEIIAALREPGTHAAVIRLRDAVKHLSRAISGDVALAALARRIAPSDRDIKGALIWLATRIIDETERAEISLASIKAEHDAFEEAQTHIKRAVCQRQFAIGGEIERVRRGYLSDMERMRTRRAALCKEGLTEIEAATFAPEPSKEAADARVAELLDEAQAIEAFWTHRDASRLPSGIIELSEQMRETA